MDHGTRMTVHISGARSERSGNLIRRDNQRAEREAFDRLKAEVMRAFAAPEESYRPLSAADVIGRFRDDWSG